MRRFAIAIAVVTASTVFTAEPSLARYEGPWCMHMSMGRDGVFSRCDMPSYEICRAEMAGLGGTYCTQNPYYWWNAKANQPRKRARRHAR